MMIVLLSFLCALGFVAVHIASKYLTFLHVIPRSKLLSGMGGVSVAYIFIHILPELNAYQYELNSGDTSGLFMDNPVYFVAMIGLAVFYGLEKWEKSLEIHLQKLRNTLSHGYFGFICFLFSLITF